MACALVATLAFTSAAFAGAAPAKPAANVFESAVPPKPNTPIDQFVFARLAQLKLEPVLCSDSVFVRRVYLDVIGTVPTAKEAREFIRDSSPNKRQLLIDRLLERDEYADFWAMRWSDVLRVKAEFPVNLWPNGAQAYHRWIRASIVANKPYDQFARELLTSSGSNFRVGPVNFYRAIQNRTPEGIASAVALAFMGVRADSLPADRLTGMAAFFSQIGYKPTSEWKEEHVFWDPLGTSAVAGNTAPGRDAIAPIAQAASSVTPAALPKPANPPPDTAVFPDGRKIKLPPDRDPRDVFADWLITPQNPWFTRSIVNRAWAWLLGRGIIHEPDDIRPDNPPSNPELLAYLEKEFVASQYDLKKLYRLILNSQTYQLSSMPRVTNPAAEANFASYPLRRLDAEVLIDAINVITGTTDLYTSAIPEPFTYIPQNQPAIAIADGSITSPFLALFGRSARATGFVNERDNKPVPAQWLHLLNSSHIQRKLEQGPKLRAILDSGRKPTDLLDELYLTILSRFPTPEEVKMALTYVQLAPTPPAPAKAAPAKTSPEKTASAKPAAVKTSNSNAPTPKAASGNAAAKAATTKAAPAKAAKPAPVPKYVLQKRREDWTDIAWSLLNSTEFLYRH